MMRSRQDRDEEERTPSREPFVELHLLVPGWQLTALERSARRQGLTVGQLLRRLIGAHLEDGGGEIAAESVPGQGAEFIITLPLR